MVMETHVRAPILSMHACMYVCMYVCMHVAVSKSHVAIEPHSQFIEDRVLLRRMAHEYLNRMFSTRREMKCLSYDSFPFPRVTFYTR